MSNAKCCLIMTTTDNIENANNIISYLMERRLAACVQLHDILSSFYWEEKLCHSKEFRLIIKTLSANYSAVEKAILECHNYQVPEIIKLDIASGLPQYLDWVKKAVK